MAPDPRHLRAQRFPLHASVESGDINRTRGLLQGPVKYDFSVMLHHLRDTFFFRIQINRKYESSGQTPLHVAASCASPAMIQILLDAGADISEIQFLLTGFSVRVMRAFKPSLDCFSICQLKFWFQNWLQTNKGKFS